MNTAYKLLDIDLRLFDVVMSTTTDNTAGNDLSPQMRIFYSDYQIDYAKASLYHNQFGQKKNIAGRNGKTIEFRVKKPFAKALTPLTEGVTPAGHKLDWGKLDAVVQQFGDYARVTDVLTVTAVDDQIAYATENNGDQAGRTLDTLTREVLNGGTSVQYASAQVAARHLLVGGSATPANNHHLTVDSIKRAVRFLKKMGARPISDGYYMAIIHPDIAYDLTNDPAWVNVKTYDPEDWYRGEIGRIAGVRFVETSEAKLFHAENLADSVRTLTVASYTAGTKTVTIDEALTAGQAAALVGRKVIIDGEQSEITAAAAGAAGAATITLKAARTEAPADNDVVYPGEAGAAGRDVYSTLVFGADAYGITEIEGLGLQFIYKPLGSGDDPLNQRATAGWKATHAAVRLVEGYMLRIESTGTFENGEAN